MIVKLGSGLLALNIVGWVLIIVTIFSPSHIIRIILGIPFVIFCPGYALMAALFIKKESIDIIARVALSFSLSIAVVAFFGLILHYTIWGIRLEPILYLVASFILIVSIISWWRRRRLTEQERYSVELKLKLPDLGQSVWDKVLAVTMMIVILGALGTLSYTLIMPKVGETFTEFYILGQGGKAENYPIDLKLGEESSVIVGIINHEEKEVSYRIEVMLGGNKITELGPVTLADAQKWESELSFVPEVVGEFQKVEFLLYKDDDIEPYLKPTYLWINVSE